MELSIPIDHINQQNIYFVEKKKNIIVEGDFIKMVYSTNSFEMNGVYIAVEFCAGPKSAVANISRPENENILQLMPSSYGGTLKMDNEQLDKSWTQIVHKMPYTRENMDSFCGKSQKRAEDIDSIKIDASRSIKKSISIDPNSRENKILIEKLCKFEQEIIKRYIDENCPTKTATYILKNQLMTNAIKYHSENREFGKKSKDVERFILKVSGVWETSTNVGITMKFTLLC